jgi:ABC-type Zn uptake system ZnuABC Zn-binding protein ZnuA
MNDRIRSQKMLFLLRGFFLVTTFPIVLTGSFLVSNQTALYAEPQPIKVVATTTSYASLVKEVGKDKVDVKAVASPRFNVHDFQPRPSDVRNVSEADLFVYTGLDLEMWMDPLVEAAGKPQFFRGREKAVDLSRGIRLLEIPTHQISRSEGDLHIFGNPHYWMNPENAKIMVETLCEKLKEVDPANASYYENNKREFISKLDSKILEWKSLCAHCEGKEIISYHKDSEYLVDFLGIKIGGYLEPKPGIPPTPRQIQVLEDTMKKRNIKGIIQPTFYPTGPAEFLAKKVGGKVITICQNPNQLPELKDYLTLVDFNVRQLAEALK